MLCEAMRLLPGNRWYQKRIEFATLVREYFGHRWYIALSSPTHILSFISCCFIQ
jgi:hypothetical protein